MLREHADYTAPSSQRKLDHADLGVKTLVGGREGRGVNLAYVTAVTWRMLPVTWRMLSGNLVDVSGNLADVGGNVADVTPSINTTATCILH